MEDIAEIIQQFGFPITAMIGLGYFVFFVWKTITQKIDPATEEMHATLIKLIVSPNEFRPVPIINFSLYLLAAK